jgi:hypothetical protein
LTARRRRRPTGAPGNLASRIRRKGDSTAPDKRKDRSQGVWDGMESAFTHVWPKSTGRIVLGPNRDKPEALTHCVLTLEVLTRDYIVPFQEEPLSGDGHRVGPTYSGLVRAGASRLPPQARFRRKRFEANIKGVIERLEREQGRQGASSASSRASRRVRGGNGDHGEGDDVEGDDGEGDDGEGDDGEGDDGEGDGEFDPRQSEGDGDLPWGAYDDPADDLLSDSLSEGADPGPDYEEGDETKRELLRELKKVVHATIATSEEHLNAAYSLDEDEHRHLLQAVKKVKTGSNGVHATLASYIYIYIYLLFFFCSCPVLFQNAANLVSLALGRFFGVTAILISFSPKKISTETSLSVDGWAGIGERIAAHFEHVGSVVITGLTAVDRHSWMLIWLEARSTG